MKTVIVILGTALALAGLQASPAPANFLPVMDAPYGPTDGSRIVNGQEAKKGQFPHQAAVRIDGRSFCGGSLISKSWVLTAAHCAFNRKSWVIILGAFNVSDNSETGRLTITTQKAAVHEKYTARTLANDLALLQLPEEVELTESIKPISLPPKSFVDEDFVGKTVRVSGWGKLKDASITIAQTLQFVDLQIISTDDCKKSYPGIIDKTRYCCSGEEKKSTCNGDSGGALTVVSNEKVTHLGVVSFVSARGCASGNPSGYAATPHYVQWISDKTGIPVQE